MYETSEGLRLSANRKQTNWRILFSCVGSGGSYSVRLNQSEALYVHQDQHTSLIKKTLPAFHVWIEPQGLISDDLGPIVVQRIYETHIE